MKQSLYDKLQVLEPAGQGMEKEERLRAASRPLLSWYHEHRRILPWREKPEPYSVWISEIMLQQTRVEAVKPYFDRFMEALPGVQALSEVTEDRLLKLWEGLGYYSRARNLKKAAQLLIEKYEGTLPASYEELKTLPGIGSYTAGAIASIAFGIPVPAVDGNVLRVISRLTGSREDITRQSVKKAMEELIKGVMPEKDPGSFNQALIETGAIVCLPNGAPLCGSCPLASLCIARENGLIGIIPVKAPKKERRTEERTILILSKDGRVAIRKRSSTGLLASLYELPGLDGRIPRELIKGALGIQEAVITPLPEAKHIFSHVEWHMTGYRVELTDLPEGDYLWVTPEEIKKTYSLPGAFKAYTKLIR